MDSGPRSHLSGLEKGAAALSPIFAPKAIPHLIALRTFMHQECRESYTCDNNDALV